MNHGNHATSRWRIALVSGLVGASLPQIFLALLRRGYGALVVVLVVAAVVLGLAWALVRKPG